MITSPYNFVPINKEVVMPFWAKHVSHDVPFENSLSGTLKVKITAHSAIYVRNGVPHNVNEKDYEAIRFNHYNDRYFIPGSSIKGMLRSVVEIMSFGRMANKVDDNRYSVRDFTNKEIYPKETFAKDVLCGWLKKENGEYKLQDCGKPARISHAVIEAQFANDMANFYKNKANVTPTTKSAESKYKKFSFQKEGVFSTFTDNANRLQCEFDPNGKEGTIILTGQPGERKEPVNEKATGKHLEFVFWRSSSLFKKVSDEVIKNFFFAYYDHDKNQQKEDWKWRKPQLERGEAIPVFFRKDDKGNIIDMGLSFLYKITYENSIVEAINKSQNNADKYDLSETIFGYTEDKKGLKGRVQIGHAFLINNAQEEAEKKEVLSGPKASYYPNYVQQSGNGTVSKYATFMDDTATIRGWKRYPVRTDSNTIPNSGENEKIKATFIPLKAGAEFTFDLHYHNLRKEELGALLSAITFHDTNGLFHSIGMAKPLGYGKISLSIENIDDTKKKDCLKAFEIFMNCELKNTSWIKSKQLEELFSMAKGSAMADTSLKYMDLDDFVVAKGKKQTDTKHTLRQFSAIANNPTTIVSLATTQDVDTAKRVYESEKNKLNAIQNKEILKNAVIEESKQSLVQALETKKQNLLNQLQVLKAEKLAKEQEEQRRKKENLIAEGSQVSIDFIEHDYDSIKKKIKDFMQKYKLKELNDMQKEKIAAALTRSYYEGKDNKKSTWAKNGDKLNAFPWNSDIKAWLGEERMKQLFNELTAK